MARAAVPSVAGDALAPRRSVRNLRKSTASVKEEDVASPPRAATKRKAPAATPDRAVKRIKSEEAAQESPSAKKKIKAESSPSPQKAKRGSATAAASGSKTAADKAAELQARKLKAYTQFSKESPYPDFAHPTPAECALARKILAELHGDRVQPQQVVAPTNRAGCGDSSSVLDALVRTILSQNTSDKNSTRAKLNMDKVYGGSDQWEAIAAGGQAKLQKAIESGGLSAVKSKAILRILEQAKAKYGRYSLDHLFEASNEDAMREMLGFQGVGPKTASCVLLFCLRRPSFAVDTHVHRITGLLGWRPASASRDEAHAHLDAVIPDEHKYALHVLLVTHGKRCDECRAGGKSTGKCALRKAFRRGKVVGGEEAVEELKREKKEEEEEEEEDSKVKNEDVDTDAGDSE